MMNITVHTFARLKDITAPEFDLSVQGKGIDSIKKAIEAKYPEAEEILGRCRFAVNEEMIDSSFSISENEHVYILPPSSGG